MQVKQRAKRRPTKAKKAVRRPRGMFRLLPLTVTMLTLLLIIKTNELYFESRKLRELYAVRSASAEEKKEESSHGDAKKEDKKEESKDASSHGEEKKEEAGHGTAEKKEESGHGEEKKEEAGHGGGHGGGEKPVAEERTFGTGKSTVKEIEEKKAKIAQPLYSKTEIDLLQNLSKRRDELDNRERELEIKSKVLEASEKRITDRMTEMKQLEAELQKVLAVYNEKQNDQLKSLVKIYENMKPDEAAAIFNEMEMPILLDVIGKMSERKVAPVLANMNPKKAKDVTQELAEKRKKAAAMAASAPAAAPVPVPATPSPLPAASAAPAAPAGKTQ